MLQTLSNPDFSWWQAIKIENHLRRTPTILRIRQNWYNLELYVSLFITKPSRIWSLLRDLSPTCHPEDGSSVTSTCGAVSHNHSLVTHWCQSLRFPISHPGIDPGWLGLALWESMQQEAKEKTVPSNKDSLYLIILWGYRSLEAHKNQGFHANSPAQGMASKTLLNILLINWMGKRKIKN